MEKRSYKIIWTAMVLLLFLSSCQDDTDIVEVESTPASEFSHKIPLTWNLLYLELERFTPGYRPPVSARNHAYINMIAYESIVPGSEGRYQSLADHYDDLVLDVPEEGVEYSWEVTLNAAYERAFELFFPTAPSEQQFQLLDVGQALRSELQSRVDVDVYRRSADYGRSIAEAIYDWSSLDTWGHRAYLNNTDPDYIPPTGLGLWSPTFPDYLNALLPHWGKCRLFSSSADIESPDPPTFSTLPGTQLYDEAMETRTLVNEIKAGQHEEDLWIAQFWSDDCPILTFTPSGRWVSVSNQLIGIERLDMLESVVLYTKVGMALADAGIRCWDEKYRHNLLRPVDYIRRFMDDSDWNTVMCPDGSGGYFTPNFPSYPSGHATFGAAAAYVLEDYFGSQYNFTDRSHEGRTEFNGTPRTFESFREMAEENGYSRIPLGVHFRVDSEAGLEMGYAVGERVTALPWQ